MIKTIKLSLPYTVDLKEYLAREIAPLGHYRILSQSLDARKAPKGRPPHYNYVVEYSESNDEQFPAFEEKMTKVSPFKERPIIIGSGPAGLFCALRLAECGVPALLLERGVATDERMKTISRYWREGHLDPDSNVCFGEGGAGLFSDGKLVTRIKSPYVPYVMNRMVQFGAPPETEYRSDPHVGSNKIRQVIKKLTTFLKEKDVEIRYKSRVVSLLVSEQDASQVVGVELLDGSRFYSEHIVLATGHSARDTYQMLAKKQVAMAPKPFALGVRIEHPRRYIDELQYGSFQKDGILGAARYRLSCHNHETNRGSYSFCMCPGGYILSAGTEKEGLVVNGMSNYARNSPWSNSGLVCSVFPSDFPDSSPLGGLGFQEKIERAAYECSKEKAHGKEIPAMTVGDFLEGRLGKAPLPTSTCPSGIFAQDLTKILPAFVSRHLQEALLHFNRSLPGFSYSKALLLAPETRTSAPVTLLRDKECYESLSHKGLYPCGEGAGHAGGITSAAVDGVNVANAILKKSL